jgi:prepilin-type N-terminal cleavage/methylation domain-containing protein
VARVKKMKNKQRTTNSKQRTYKAFTLIELVVAVALLAIVFLFAGTIFKVSIGSYRTSVANAEIMLFADGDFQSYETYKNGKRDSSGEPICGSVARICYMLANKPDNPNPPIRPSGQEPQKRILARTQHILTADAQFKNAPLTPDGTSSELDWYNWNDVNEYEYDMNSLDKWKNIPWLNKRDILTVITDITVYLSVVSENIRGTMVDPADANLIHNFLCEGVGEFKVQGWYAAGKRWVPEVDPNGNGVLTDDSDFFLNGGEIDPIKVPGVLYPYPPYGAVDLGGEFYCDLLTPAGQAKFAEFQSRLNENRFDEIPGLGRALKFTFTLYDSKGVIKEGRIFTHIVYIGN